MTPAIPCDPNALLTRDQAAAALAAAGFPIRAKTLATKASRGGGPPFRRFGAKPLYRWCETLCWAEARLSAPIVNTSELDAA
ncbi:MAG: DNA-binding protein [Beijerinckiaceae bacterium]